MTLKNELITIDLIIINNKILINDEFKKDFRFDITIAKLCLIKKFRDEKTILIKDFY